MCIVSGKHYTFGQLSRFFNLIVSCSSKYLYATVSSSRCSDSRYSCITHAFPVASLHDVISKVEYGFLTTFLTFRVSLFSSFLFPIPLAPFMYAKHFSFHFRKFPVHFKRIHRHIILHIHSLWKYSSLKKETFTICMHTFADYPIDYKRVNT